MRCVPCLSCNVMSVLSSAEEALAGREDGVQLEIALTDHQSLHLETNYNRNMRKVIGSGARLNGWLYHTLGNCLCLRVCQECRFSYQR